MIEKITKSALAMREFLAMFVVCFILVAGTYWIAFTWWPTEIEHKNNLVKILNTTNQRLVAIEKILEK